jgi:hypothetical protein
MIHYYLLFEITAEKILAIDDFNFFIYFCLMYLLPKILTILKMIRSLNKRFNSKIQYDSTTNKKMVEFSFKCTNCFLKIGYHLNVCVGGGDYIFEHF